MRRSVVIERLGYEASAGWTTYGTLLAAYSSFQGVAHCDMNDSIENKQDYSRPETDPVQIL